MRSSCFTTTSRGYPPTPAWPGHIRGPPGLPRRPWLSCLAAEQILSHIDNGQSIPDDTAALTFDDAYASVFSEAYPRLKRRGWPFTVFVSTDYIDRHYKNYMTWDRLPKWPGMGRS